VFCVTLQDDIDAESVGGFDDQQQAAGTSLSLFAASSTSTILTSDGLLSSSNNRQPSLVSWPPLNTGANAPCTITSSSAAGANDQPSTDFFNLSSVTTHAGSGGSSASSSYSGVSSVSISASACDMMSVSSGDSCNDSDMRSTLTSSSGVGSSFAGASASAASSSPIHHAGTSTPTYDISTPTYDIGAGSSHFQDSKLLPVCEIDGDSNNNIVWECWSPPKSYGKQNMLPGSQHTTVINGEHKKRKKANPVIYNSDNDDTFVDDNEVGKSPMKRRCQNKEDAATATVDNAAAETSVKTVSDVLKHKKQPSVMKEVNEWTG